MQVCVVDKPSPDVPLSDVEKMQRELNTIKKCMEDIEAGKATSSTFDSIANALTATSEIVLSLDNANDFFKIGGFQILLPLLETQSVLVHKATCELIADLVQNNSFCQQKALDVGLLTKLISILRLNEDPDVCIKALYAVSCLCRHNKEAIARLPSLGAVEVFLKLLRIPVERMRTKLSFFLTHLINQESTFRDDLLEGGFIESVIYLLQLKLDSTHEHLLSALLAQVKNHERSRTECSKEKYGLKDILDSLLAECEGKGEFLEAKDYCLNLKNICFSPSK